MNRKLEIQEIEDSGVHPNQYSITLIDTLES